MNTATIAFARPAAPNVFATLGAHLRRAMEQSGDAFLVQGARYL
jgi:hypothetical protein